MVLAPFDIYFLHFFRAVNSWMAGNLGELRVAGPTKNSRGAFLLIDRVSTRAFRPAAAAAFKHSYFLREVFVERNTSNYTFLKV